MSNEIEPAQIEVNGAPTLDSNLAFWQQRIDRLEAEVGDFAGTNQWPEWWDKDTERLHSVIPDLKEENTDISNVSKYYDIHSKEAELRSVITGHPRYGHPLQSFAYQLGEDLVGRAFSAEPASGSLHIAMLEDLNEQVKESSGSLTPELNILREAYGVQTLTELLGVSGDEYNDELRKLMHTETPIRWMRFNDEEHSDEFQWSDMQDATRAWMSKAVESATGIETSEASDYVFSASRRGEKEDILSVIRKFDYFGVDRIREISKFSGIHGLEAYSIEQLERMEKLANNPEQAAKQLSQHDVSVVLINRFGDHNGVMHNVAADFDDDSGRVLFFEISTMADIYRSMSMLHKSGIQPSTLVLNAHSAPGQFSVSDRRETGAKRTDIAAIAGRRLVRMANADSELLAPGEHGYSMHGMKGMARLVEEYMQPSRAIDDDASDAGRKKIIFQACHAATEAKVADLDEHDKKTQVGTESVISQLGKDLITSGLTTAVDIYGAPAGIQMHRTILGVRYSGQPIDFGEGRTAMHAERVRVQGGSLSKQQVEEITLRKAA